MYVSPPGENIKDRIAPNDRFDRSWIFQFNLGHRRSLNAEADIW